MVLRRFDRPLDVVERQHTIAVLDGHELHHCVTGGRALFVIDGDGIIRWSYLSPAEINPGADGILTALESLSLKASVR